MDTQILEKFDKQQEKIDKLEKDLQALNDEFYRNNFSTYQLFTKYSNFTVRLKVPHYDRLPATSDSGELIEYNNGLYIGGGDTWQLVGSQS